ncbi:MAG TPA: methyltransferase domain-containing protein [Gemmatimonadaceae bacterium]|jgi:SAM-dependent methyltransferase|nr:methyltransferase domain-containing protein [Gemmatimonadaceae bacterium]
MPLLTPARRQGAEILDDPATPPAIRERSMRDLPRSNALLGGAHALLAELRRVLPTLGPRATLLDVGTGLADLPARAARLARRHGVALTTIGCDGSELLLRLGRARVTHAACGHALALPFADRSVDVVTCSQVLHHFAHDDAVTLLRELHRVARRAVIVSDLRRHWIAAAGFWLASFPLGFHRVTRHDGVVSVLKGFTPGELAVLSAEAGAPGARVRRRVAFRLTASWGVA